MVGAAVARAGAVAPLLVAAADLELAVGEAGGRAAEAAGVAGAGLCGAAVGGEAGFGGGVVGAAGAAFLGAVVLGAVVLGAGLDAADAPGRLSAIGAPGVEPAVLGDRS
jgi:hypothetical protein